MQTTEQRLERLEKHNRRLTTALTMTVVAGLPVLVHLRRDLLACDKRLRTHIAQPAVRSFRVVMLSPILNDDAGFA